MYILDDNNNDAVFVVPGYHNFTPRQIAMLIDAGQQPGVPFRLGASGGENMCDVFIIWFINWSMAF